MKLCRFGQANKQNGKGITAMSIDTNAILKRAVEQGASDLFLIPGLPLSYKLNGRIMRQSTEPLLPDVILETVKEIYHLTGGRTMDRLQSFGDDDFSFSIKGLSRFRVSAFKQRGSLAAIIRIVQLELPDYRELHIPDSVISIAEKTKGLVLVTGPAGSGKSTTLACIIDEINRAQSAHIITLEDPIEYLHRHKKSVVTQREIGTDSESYVVALRAALRQAPDVILLGEMRDYETIKTAITAAETGHLVISTLHTIGAANTIDRIIDSFAPNQQQQIRIQLSTLLVAIVSQQLLPTVDGREIPAFEIVFLDRAIRNMIRETKTHQIDSVIRSSADEGMVSMDDSLLELYRQKLISRETLLIHCTSADMMERRISREEAGGN